MIMNNPKIISVSRRIDIPAFYSDWFMGRVSEGYVCVKNPFDNNKYKIVSLVPKCVDAIVFWTKNPIPLFPYIDELNKTYKFYFQFTLNAYDSTIETNVPSKDKVLIPAFQRLSDLIGSSKVLWRYDPIMFSEKLSIDYHLRYFERIAKRLRGYTERCTISFLDVYPKLQRTIGKLGIIESSVNDIDLFLNRLSKIAFENEIQVYTCSEQGDFTRFGIRKASCIDKELIESLIGKKINVGKDKSQRSQCGCCSSVDIGAYNTCKHGCKYCYASNGTVVKDLSIESPLIGAVPERSVITGLDATKNFNLF